MLWTGLKYSPLFSHGTCSPRLWGAKNHRPSDPQTLRFAAAGAFQQPTWVGAEPPKLIAHVLMEVSTPAHCRAKLRRVHCSLLGRNRSGAASGEKGSHRRDADPRGWQHPCKVPARGPSTQPVAPQELTGTAAMGVAALIGWVIDSHCPNAPEHIGLGQRSGSRRLRGDVPSTEQRDG